MKTKGFCVIKLLRGGSPEVFLFRSREAAEEHYGLACKSIGRVVSRVLLAAIEQDEVDKGGDEQR